MSKPSFLDNIPGLRRVQPGEPPGAWWTTGLLTCLYCGVPMRLDKDKGRKCFNPVLIGKTCEPYIPPPADAPKETQ